MIVSRNRSVLFVPASNCRAMSKIRGLASDMFIMDLEDAVAPERKIAARQNVVKILNEKSVDGTRCAVRVNPRDTDWYKEDLAAIGPLAVEAIVLPKIGNARDLYEARDAIGKDRPAFLAMVETCTGVMNLRGIVDAAQETGLVGLVAGTNDLGLDMRCRPDADRTALRPVLTAIIVAARSRQLIVLDGVYNELDNGIGFLRECLDGAMLGFDGKTLIHPSQIDAANNAFSPTSSEVAWARRIVTAFQEPEARDRGVIRLDGKMVERLHLAHAEKVLAIAPP